jgi:hypothetical protein
MAYRRLHLTQSRKALLVRVRPGAPSGLCRFYCGFCGSARGAPVQNPRIWQTRLTKYQVASESGANFQSVVGDFRIQRTYTSDTHQAIIGEAGDSEQENLFACEKKSTYRVETKTSGTPPNVTFGWNIYRDANAPGFPIN